MDKVFGWITPAGKFIRCGVFEHAAILVTEPALAKLLVAEVLCERQLRVVRNKCMKDNAEWHMYEMMQCDVESRRVYDAYSGGAVRVGSVDSVLYFEGTIAGLKSTLKAQKKVADKYGFYRVESITIELTAIEPSETLMTRGEINVKKKRLAGRSARELAIAELVEAHDRFDSSWRAMCSLRSSAVERYKNILATFEEKFGRAPDELYLTEEQEDW